MKNNKSLVWGLIGLAVIILVALYAYNEDQKRRLAEAETTEEQKAGTPEKTEETETAVAPTEQPADETAAAGEDSAADSTDSGTADTSDTDSAAASTDTVQPDETDSTAAQTKAADENDKTEETMADSDAAQTAPASAAPTEPVAAPQFDIVRVEPDGSTVIAGQAKAGATVEVVTGDRVLAESEVGQSGDFAAIFDDPLAPGDYEIVLRVVEEGDVVAQSEEVATVSVPEENPEQLLVIVTKPGEASRILTQPEAVETASTTGEQPAAPAAGAKEAGANTAAASSADTGSKDDASAPAKLSAETSAPETETTTAKTDTEKPTSSENAPAASNTAEAGDTDPVTLPAESGSEVAALADTEEPAENKAAQVPEKAEQPAPPADSGSAASESAAVGDTANEAAAAAKLRIDAVEIEGGRIFVAGSATPGASVRVYADGTAIGDSPVSDTGRFLVEAERDISVGQHTISADLMMPGTDAAMMRVAVPFTRPAGETVAAVAAPATSDASEKVAAGTPEDEADQPAERTAMATTGATASAPSTATDPSDKTDNDMTVKSEPVAPANEAMADAAKDRQTGETAMSETTEPQDASKETVAAETKPESMSPAAKTKIAESEASPTPAKTETNAQSDMTAKKESSSSSAPSSADAVVEEPDQQKMTDTAVQSQATDRRDTADSTPAASSSGTQMAAADTRSAEPETVIQEALEAKEGSVIIRRGDTLWQISRRVYGRGVRYTTIYLANSDQISNPDFIEPGQIFMVPDEPLTNAEELHRERIKRR